MHIPLGARPFVGRLSAMLLNLGQPLIHPSGGWLLGNNEGTLFTLQEKGKVHT